MFSNRKIIIGILLFLTLTCLCFAACAASSGDCGPNLTWVLDDNGVLTISKTGTGNNGDMDNYDGANLSPWTRNQITAVVVEDGVTSIGSSAFYECPRLTTVTIGKDVTRIGGQAFGNCDRLASVALPQGLKTLDYSVFQDSDALKAISIPNGTETLGGSLFYECDSLAEVSLPESITEIPSNCFANCNSLKSISLPSGVTAIGDSAFAGCTSLSSVNIPAGVTQINGSTFNGCTSLASVTIPQNVTKICSSAFSYSGLKSVAIPEGVLTIEGWAFNGCGRLSFASLPASLLYIRECAFDGSALTDVFYPEPDRDGIIISNNNEGLNSAVWHYGESAPASGNLDDVRTITYTAKFAGYDPYCNPSFTVTATATCRKHPEHTLQEEAENFWAECDTGNAATCTTPGKYTVHADYFRYRGFAGQCTVTNVEAPAYGHEYVVDQNRNPVYGWSLDNKKAYAAIGCCRCWNPVYDKVEEVNTTVASVGSGKKVYTAVFQDPMFKTQTKTVESGRDITPPQLKKVYIDTKTVSKPGILLLTIEFEEEETGLSHVEVNIVNQENTLTGYGRDFSYDTPRYTGRIQVEMPLDDKTKTGTYRVEWLMLNDSQGNGVRYEFNNANPNELVARDSQAWSIIIGRASIADNSFEVVEDAAVDFQLHISNPKLAEAISNLPAGGHGMITFDVNNHVAPAKLFNAMKGKNAKFTFSSNEIQWVFNGTDIVREAKNIDLLTNSYTTSGKTYGTQDDVLIINFADNGQLPGKATIRIKSNYYFKIYNLSHAAYLYYLDGSDLITQSSGVTAVIDKTDHWCEFQVTHNSSYLVAPNAISGAAAQKRTSIAKAKVTVKDQVYTGSKLKPTITVKLNGTKLKKGTDYTVAFKNNTDIGKATVTITGTGKYKGKVTVNFKIIPKPVKLSTLTPKKTKLTVSWKKGSKITGYEIEYSLKKNFSKSKTVTVKGAKNVSTVIKNLKQGRVYYIRIRTYKTVNGKKYYSEWSAVKKQKLKGKAANDVEEINENETPHN